MKVIADTLKIGDKIMPPEREIRLWMRRELTMKNLPESALHLTITKIQEANPDKNGAWLFLTCDHSAEWLGDAKPYSFKFKVRPVTPWHKVEA